MSVLEDQRFIFVDCGKWYTAALTGMQIVPFPLSILLFWSSAGTPEVCVERDLPDHHRHDLLLASRIAIYRLRRALHRPEPCLPNRFVSPLP